jgi:hypothetical protein
VNLRWDVAGEIVEPLAGTRDWIEPHLPDVRVARREFEAFGSAERRPTSQSE